MLQTVRTYVCAHTTHTYQIIYIHEYAYKTIEIFASICKQTDIQIRTGQTVNYVQNDLLYDNDVFFHIKSCLSQTM